MFESKPLNKKQVKNILSNIESYYNADVSNLEDYYFYLNEKTNKLYIANFDINSFNLSRINSYGMYFATIHDNNRLRLSIEGSKLINPKKNFIVIDDESLKSYVTGENLFKEEVLIKNLDGKSPFLIVIYEDENIGTISIKDNFLLNYVPKSRRLDFNKIF